MKGGREDGIRRGNYRLAGPLLKVCLVRIAHQEIARSLYLAYRTRFGNYLLQAWPKGSRKDVSQISSTKRTSQLSPPDLNLSLLDQSVELILSLSATAPSSSSPPNLLSSFVFRPQESSPIPTFTSRIRLPLVRRK